jgi:hypothetical protein
MARAVATLASGHGQFRLIGDMQYRDAAELGRCAPLMPIRPTS